MSKSRDAFRTISEVSEALDVPAHVLRFWESKFAQVKPVKRAGGRRYYRPADVDLLAGIKKLLHEDGMTIKGAQKLLREQGVKSVSALGAALLPDDAIDGTATDTTTTDESPTAIPDADTAPAAESGQPPAKPFVEITNIVPLSPRPVGPSVKVDAAPHDIKDASAPDHSETVEASSTLPPPEPAGSDTQSDAAVSVPADPSDSDSKASARLFHLLREVPSDKIAARAGSIAPLLDRMRDLRGRIETR